MYFDANFLINREFDSMICDEQFFHYYNTIENMLTTMFVYENLPETLPAREIEHNLIRYGSCLIVRFADGTYYAGVPALRGQINNYGFGEQAICTTRNGKKVYDSYYNKEGSNAILIWNNSQYMPDFDIFRYANLFADVDKSINLNVINSRLHPIPVARDGKLKQAIDGIFKNIRKGKKTYSVINDVSFSDIVNNKDNAIPVLNLTDVTNADKIQYLSKLHDDLVARLGRLYGQNINSNGKMAQQTIKELSGYDTLSAIIPYDRLACRKDAFEKFGKFIGLENVTVKFNHAWEHLLDDCEVSSEEREVDNEEEKINDGSSDKTDTI